MSETNGTTSVAPTNLMEVFTDALSRMMFTQHFGTSHHEMRDYYEVLGYPRESTYLTRYDYATKDSLGRRLVRNFPRHTWQYPPTIRDTEDVTLTTPFMEAWETLVRRHKIWRRFERVDRQACIGNYAILFFGLRGRENAAEPVQQRARTLDDLLFVQSYSQRYVRVETFETDTTSARFGLPKTYQLERGPEPQTASDEALAGIPLVPTTIDASRVVHVAEDLIEDDVFAVPRLESMIPRLIDLMKIAGGSAEMFWRHASRELAFSVDSDKFRFEGDDAKAKFETQVEEFIHKMRRFLLVEGMNIKELAPGVVSPLDHFQTQAALLAADSEIPQRLLFGSERGELASTQDIRSYVAVVAGRQVHFAEPTIIDATIERLVQFGILPEPAMPLIYEWPNLFDLGEEEMAKIAADWATAIQRYDQADIQSGGSIIHREEARATIFAPLGIAPEEPADPEEPFLGDEDI